MKAVIFAGGYGTRISEETHIRPKPMIEIGQFPIIWHILKIYSFHGINEFIICCGYKGYVIKEYFSNYLLHSSDVLIDLEKNKITYKNNDLEPWKIHLVDTGENTMTGGRLKRVEHLLKDDDYFCLTYGDGLSDIDITNSIKFHKKHKKIATITSVIPPGRFGSLKISKSKKVESFYEKPPGDGNMINGGFFVLSPDVINYIDDEQTAFEQEPLKNLAKDQQLMSYTHKGFWHPMDTLRDKNYLEELIIRKKASWIKW